MKNLLKINLMAILVLAFCAIGTAQDKQQRMSREQLAEKQAKHIAHELAFDETTTQKFVETFCAYQQEMWASRSALSAASKFLTCARNIMRNTANFSRRSKSNGSTKWNVKSMTT